MGYPNLPCELLAEAAVGTLPFLPQLRIETGGPPANDGVVPSTPIL